MGRLLCTPLIPVRLLYRPRGGGPSHSLARIGHKLTRTPIIQGRSGSLSGSLDGRLLSEFCTIFQGDLVDLLSSELLGRSTGWIAGVTEEAFQSSWRHDPEQEQFVIGIRESMPGVLRDEYRSALLKGARFVIQNETPVS